MSLKEDVEELSIDSIDIFDCMEINDDGYFARIIGCIEDIIMDEEFVKLHSDFMDNYWHEFDDDDENKLIYTHIFRQYNEIIEKFIEKQLTEKLPEFSMVEFEKELRTRHNELNGEIFEILLTFSDFASFKSKFLDYKAMKEGKTLDFSEYLSVSQYITTANN